MWTRKAILLTVVSSLGQVGAQAPAGPPFLPTIIAGELPKFDRVFTQARLEGFTVLRITTDGTRASEIEVLRPMVMLSDAAVAAVRTWRFASHQPTRFEATLAHVFEDVPGDCSSNGRTPRWEIRFPVEIRVFHPLEMVDCEPPAARRGAHPPPPPVPAVVDLSAIVYPEVAREAGVDGGVHVQFKPGGGVEAVSGPDELRAAALDHARSWKFAAPLKGELNVGYSFVLLPSDCSVDQGVSVRMDPPRTVEVVAKRPSVCERGLVADAPVPVVVSPLPTTLHILSHVRLAGDVRLMVTTDGTRPVAMELADIHQRRQTGDVDLSTFLRTNATEIVRAWRFAAHPPTTFVTRITLRNAPSDGCSDADFGNAPTFIGRVPSEFTVISPSGTLCHPPPPPPLRVPYVVRSLRGQLYCSCRDRSAVANKRVSAYRSPQVASSTITDNEGRFAFEAMPPGTYTLTIEEFDLVTRWFEVDVSATASEVPIRLEVDRDPNYVALGTRTAWAQTKVPPDYPADLRRAGVEGDVRIQVMPDGSVRGFGTESLVASAAAAVRQWKFDDPHKQGAEVRFTFRLEPGDCERDQNPVLIWRRNHVEIVAKRPMACGR